MSCDNCGANGDIAYTLRTHPATESDTASESDLSTESETNSATESIDLRFCSADCLQEWTTVPSATFVDEPSIRRRLRSTDRSRIVDGSK
ncbi:hypothetical protein [Halostagnicola sp. A-GB9-2]|uniref:hypothetical protein n=1 Tax=Halostagnicola sp. A-GB9-2 TaxID=3048066 RepID=UPI0024BFCAC8|nr:hypothetical protein [Halostagnicola sp. A-GB9-2]MDJ1433378.1 hypothetical protein [Halostagnicola sp. A-GB9-2]